MREMIRIVIFITLFLFSYSVWGANTVTVQSLTVNPGDSSVTVGVFIENDVALSTIQIPLEFRETDTGAYITDTLYHNVQGRVAASGLMDLTIENYYPDPETSNICSGPVSSSYSLSGDVNFVSPDAHIWAGAVMFNPCLPAGSDGNTPSFIFTFNVTDTLGAFEIDTCCIVSNNHLIFTECGTGQQIAPSFTKGVITIGYTNRVTVQSLSVEPGASSVSVGVFIDNIVDIGQLHIPLEFRENVPGSFIANSITHTVQGRVAGSGLMDLAAELYYPDPETSNVCSGPISQSYSLSGDVDFVSPDAHFWIGAVLFSPCLPAGSDGDTPSFVFTFDVTDTTGTFEIDTCCIVIGSNNHLFFGECGTGQPINPYFTKGVVAIQSMIPTLNEWGMLIMGLLLLAVGTATLIRRGKSHNICRSIISLKK
ncbi:MAG: IPTL-CTERM sorting domain-containing protein [Candidatus Zixiibacteriota bacterium]|nr:MAG: IPTL-CTERM sorting domain-containing protein [candidate division Zixibacteria bacterium]